MQGLFHDGRASRVIRLALPIIFGMVSQNVINLVDMAMVGTLGDAALAAVGLGGFLNLACLALLVGLSISVQATAARRKGEGRSSELAVALNGGLLILLCIAPPLSALFYLGSPSAYAYLNPDPEVVAQGVPYLNSSRSRKCPQRNPGPHSRSMRPPNW